MELKGTFNNCVQIDKVECTNFFAGELDEETIERLKKERGSLTPAPSPVGEGKKEKIEHDSAHQQNREPKDFRYFRSNVSEEDRVRVGDELQAAAEQGAAKLVAALKQHAYYLVNMSRASVRSTDLLKEVLACLQSYDDAGHPRVRIKISALREARP